MKHKIFSANWKMYKTPQETREFFKTFKSFGLAGDILFFPNALCLEAAIESVKDSKIQIGVQNIYPKNEGAFTGENSADLAKKMGVHAVLVGHSERRTLFRENEILADKVQHAQNLGLRVVFCIGETLDEREKNQTESVLVDQLKTGLSKAQKNNLVIAYEPVWAIGSGKTASTEQAQSAHAFVAGWLEKNNFAGTPILYGGSVKPENAGELMAQPDISGFLVGGASLDPESFKKICSV